MACLLLLHGLPTAWPAAWPAYLCLSAPPPRDPTRRSLAATRVDSSGFLLGGGVQQFAFQRAPFSVKRRMALGSKTTDFLFPAAVSRISCGKAREISGKSSFFSTGQPAISKAYPLKSHRTRQEQRHLRNKLGQGCLEIRVALATYFFSMTDADQS